MDIPPLSTFEDITKRYKKLVKKYHPDINSENELINDINKAYEILKNYVKNYKFSFTEDEIQRQYPEDFLKKFKV